MKKDELITLDWCDRGKVYSSTVNYTKKTECLINSIGTIVIGIYLN